MASDMNTVIIDETLPIRPRVLTDPAASPWGMLAYDRGTLSSVQQENLNRIKTSVLRKENRSYLMAHPQVTAVVSVILRAVYLHRPKNTKEFIAKMVGRSDFEDNVRRCLLQNGPRRRDERNLGKDLYECLNPELLIGKHYKVYPEKEKICLDVPDEDLGIESMYPANFALSVDSLEVFSAIGVKAINLEKKMDEYYRRTEDSARKFVKNYLNLRSDKYTSQTEVTEEEGEQLFPSETSQTRLSRP